MALTIKQRVWSRAALHFKVGVRVWKSLVFSTPILKGSRLIECAETDCRPKVEWEDFRDSIQSENRKALDLG
jgi:hypothetical protein